MLMSIGKCLASTVLMIVMTLAGIPASAEEKPEFSAKVMSDPANFELGKEIWFEQCTHCHGYKAYPGKAPKLKPGRYKAEFVFKRVSKGFRKMPAWEDVYDRKERIAVVVYIMHKDFSP